MITFPQSGQYRLSFRAKDPEGAYSGYWYQWIDVEDDTDSDGIPSPNDRDDDGGLHRDAHAALRALDGDAGHRVRQGHG